VRRPIGLVALPIAFAVDWGIVPLISLWFLCRAIFGARLGGPIAVGVVGMVLLAACAFEQITAARERSDIHRALTPLLSVPVADVQPAPGRSFNIGIPN